MNYLNKSFRSPAATKAFRDNWDETFAANDKCSRCGHRLDDRGMCPNATPKAIGDE